MAQVARPLLTHISVTAIAAGVSERMATHYRQGTKDPGPETSPRLIALLKREARRMLRRRSSPPEA